MAFRVCCSCKNPPGPSEGFISRFCRVTQTLGSVIGTEDYFWSLMPGYSDRWRIQIDPAPTGEYLLEGFRVEWMGPTENGQRFNGVVSSSAFSGSHANAFYNVANFHYQKGGIVGSGSTVESSWIDKTVFSRPTDLLNDRVKFGGHCSTDAIRGIYFQWPTFMQDRAVSGSFPERPIGNMLRLARVKYWRLIENGVPVSDIMYGYHPQSRTRQVLYPIADVSTSTWQVSTGGDFWAAIDEDPFPTITGPTDYIWTTATDDPITFELPDFLYTGGDNYVKLLVRAAVTDSSGTITGGVCNVMAELLYNGEVIANGPMTSNSAFWQFTGATFKYPSDIVQSAKDSSNFIPKDANPSSFRLRLRRLPGHAGRQFAIAALQVASEPFGYDIGSRTSVELGYYWPINRGSWIPWRKNKRLGFDIWFEINYTTGYQWRGAIGRNDDDGADTPGLYGEDWPNIAHGTIGLRTTFMPEFDLSRDSFKIKFLNGTWRPVGLDLGSNDTLTFHPSTIPQWGGGPQTLGVRPGWQRGQGIFLTVNQEVPELTFRDITVNGVSRDVMRYLPEDTGHAVTNFKFRANNTLGDVYVNVQTPGGIWKYTRPTKFVLERPCQTSGTNSFTPQEYEDIEGFPTEIEVSIAKPPRTYTYTEDDTWTCPDHVTSVTVECFGGGGGGGGTDGDTASSAGGGGGGGYSKYTNLTVTPGETYDITVGAGGAAGTLGGGNGGNGSATEFSYSGSALCKALGGTGGQGATAENASPGGSGASTGSAVGTTKFSGGNGAAGATNGTGVNGGGGGSSGASSGNGTNATNSTGATKSGAGSGGSGRSVPVLTPLPGTAGFPPGGGGGGGVAWNALGSTGYAGGDGRLTLTY